MSKESTNQMPPRLHYVLIWVMNNCFYRKKVPRKRSPAQKEQTEQTDSGPSPYTKAQLVGAAAKCFQTPPTCGSK